MVLIFSLRFVINVFFNDFLDYLILNTILLSLYSRNVRNEIKFYQKETIKSETVVELEL